MVRFLIEIEAVARDPKSVNIVLKTERNQPTEAEEKDALHLLPALRNVLKRRFPDGDESQQPDSEEVSPNH